MKNLKRITESPWKEILDEEWKRANTIIKFSLNKPTFYWGSDSMMGRAVGRCFRSFKRIDLWAKYKFPKFDDVIDDFRGTIRHELAHYATAHLDSHGEEFRIACDRLGGNRYCSSNVYNHLSKAEYPKKPKKILSNDEILQKKIERANEQVKRFSMRVKRDNTLLKKWQSKLKRLEKKLNK